MEIQLLVIYKSRSNFGIFKSKPRIIIFLTFDAEFIYFLSRDMYLTHIYQLPLIVLEKKKTVFEFINFKALSSHAR